MKIVSFTINNYRSISKAYKLPLSDYSVIVGPNNEGKSNILKGFALALSFLTSGAFRMRRAEFATFKVRRNQMNLDYEWPKDFPISLQKSNPDGKTEFTLEFELTEHEKAEFTKKVKVSLRTNLKAKVTIGKEQKNIEFIVSGKAKKTFNKKIDEISSFIDSKLLIQYIPAIKHLTLQ